ncbi:MAG: DoxX family protein [Flavobacteriaceae bacterium]|nr:MAG: DoxX family protein [Flavobacteriaceae bacterium]
MKIIYTLITTLFGLFMAMMGLNKFLPFIEQGEMPPKSMEAIELLTTACWVMPLAGVVELLAGVLLMIPRLKNIGAIMIFPVLVGILLFNLKSESSFTPMTIGLLLINLWMLWENRERLKELF